MNESTNICLSCGLCCDGTLIGFVQLDKEEITEVKKVKSDIEEVDGKGFFFQPCNDYCDGCTIYDKRPKQCGIFKCGLLKSVEQNELEFDTAVDIVATVKQQKLKIEKQIAELKLDLETNSFYYKSLEVKKLLLNGTSELSPKHQDLISDIEQLDKLISTKFDLW